jgi:hydrogenase nickel incorporation protein HypB
MFRSVDVVLLNKIDLVPHLDADVNTYIAHVRQVNPTPRSCRSVPAPARV